MADSTPGVPVHIQPVHRIGAHPETMGGRPDRGFLVLADISGFTAFVTSTELEHGPPIIAELLERVVRQLSPPLEIQEVEGDAVFAIAPDRVPLHPVSLLGLFGKAVVAFKNCQREMQETTTCSCAACAKISTLNLKIVAHYGSFVRQTVGGRSQAAGSDVILVHRLLKNRVGRTDGYLLLTKAALQRIGVDPIGAGLRAYTESYEHLGEVNCFVADLAYSLTNALSRSDLISDCETV